jgi:hypothetical protein
MATETPRSTAAASSLLDQFLGAIGLGDDERTEVGAGFAELIGDPATDEQLAESTALSMGRNEAEIRLWNDQQQSAHARVVDNQRLLQQMTDLKTISQDEFLELSDRNDILLEQTTAFEVPKQLRSLTGFASVLADAVGQVGGGDRMRSWLEESQGVRQQMDTVGPVGVVLGIHSALDKMDFEIDTTYEANKIARQAAAEPDPKKQNQLLGQLTQFVTRSQLAMGMATTTAGGVSVTKSEMEDMARTAVKQFGEGRVDEGIYLNQINQESKWDPGARSGKGAAGLPQFMPATAREWGLRVDGSVDERLDPQKSLEAGVRYMAHLLKLYRGDQALALAAYNAGMGNLAKMAVTAPGTKSDVSQWPEPTNYVRSILGVEGNLNDIFSRGHRNWIPLVGSSKNKKRWRKDGV